ncbi:class II aldolase/adducin family protein [Magnetospirillum sulfuroxidans]|uniref:Class II aldolase/adducin family protein n=1 Tax=Magnetospirillum sulfuroxidans TaxID=611300 RepID=A0ABS5IF04_9PROT|nr:class II aldolase/adducin family protein [Magnetospirillum sulfuroxidans]MBR9973000.1 class II aldolase/adducin family protein [Magnetospirillum sulfuroxidans]
MSIIVDAVRLLAARGLNQGASGNISMRLGDGFIITPSGVSAETLVADQLVAMDMEGHWSGSWKPSSEWRFHRDLYAAHPETQAVVHCHSPAATALAVLGKPLPAFHYMVAIAGGADVRCAPYATFGSQALSDGALAALSDRKACLLAHHGMISMGRDLAQAVDIAVEVEFLADLYLRLLPLGEPPRLPAAEMAVVLEKFKSYGANAQND